MNDDGRRFPRTTRSEELFCFFMAGTTEPNGASFLPHIERKKQCKSFRSQYDVSNLTYYLESIVI